MFKSTIVKISDWVSARAKALADGQRAISLAQLRRDDNEPE